MTFNQDFVVCKFCRPQVKAGYLQQQFSDRPGTAHSCSSKGYGSPRSPIHSPTPSADAAIFTSHSVTHGSGVPTGLTPNISNKARSAPCTPRTADDEADAASVAGSSCLTPQTLQQVSGTQQAIEAADGLEVLSNSRLRRSASLPSVPLLLQAEQEQMQRSAAELSSCGQQAQVGVGLAAAVAGLRQNFSDISVISRSQGALGAGLPQDEATNEGVAEHQKAACSPSESAVRPQVQQHQQQVTTSSPDKLPPPPLESSQSPSFASGGKSANRTDGNIISSRSDRSLLPLNLSPVPFELSVSVELGASAVIDSPGAASSVSMVTTAAAEESPTPSKQQHQHEQEEFVTPLAVSCRPSASDESASIHRSAAAAVPTPYFTPKQPDSVAAGLCQAETPETPEATANSSLRKIAAGVGSFTNSPASGSPAPSSCSERSMLSAADLDDEADVLIGSMTEAEFASAVGRTARGIQGGDAGRPEAEMPVSAREQRQQHVSAAEPVAKRQQSRLAQGSSGSLRQHVQHQATGVSHMQQQQQRKLSKNQKKKLRQKLKRQSQQQQLQQHDSDVSPSGETMLAGWVQQQSLEHVLDSNMTVEGSRHSAGNHEDSTADAPAAGGQADSPPKMLLRGPGAAAAAATALNGSNGLVGGRYGSPVKRRIATASPFAAAAASSPKSGAKQMLSNSIASSVGDVCSPVAAAAHVHEDVLMAVGTGGDDDGPSSGGSRLKSMKSSLGSPSRASCSSIKSLVAHSRLRDAELGSSSGSSRMGSSSPQRFRSKFGIVGSDALPAGVGAVISSMEGLKSSSGYGRTGPGDQGVQSALLPQSCVADDLSTPVNMPAFEPACAGAAQKMLEGHQYRSSVHWKALSDSVTFSASEPLPRLSSRGSGAASPAASMFVAASGSPVVSVPSAEDHPDVTLLAAGSESANWKVAENVLYFE